MTHPDSPVEALMTAQPVALDPADTLDDAFALLERYPFRHLPIVKLNELVGIVSDRDLYLATGLPRGREGAGKGRAARPIREIMRTEVKTVSPLTSVRSAVRRMLEEHIGALPVVTDSGTLVGIVTEVDFLRAFHRCTTWPAWDSQCAAPVREHMSSPVVTAEEHEDLLTAAEPCLASRIRHLPVRNAGRLVGMLSDRDIRLGLARLMRKDRSTDGARDVPRLCVGDVMQRPCLTISPACTLRSAAHTMLETRIGALPVVEEDELIGILSQTDLLQVYAAMNTFAA
jgi:CBS domain-containing protein